MLTRVVPPSLTQPLTGLLLLVELPSSSAVLVSHTSYRARRLTPLMSVFRCAFSVMSEVSPASPDSPIQPSAAPSHPLLEGLMVAGVVPRRSGSAGAMSKTVVRYGLVANRTKS